MKKKYELIEDDKVFVGVDTTTTLYRIKALRNFGDVKKGDIGGYIEKEENLSHIGNCWVADSAKVFGDATIKDNALVSERATVCGYATVRGNAKVFQDVLVYHNAAVYNNAIVRGQAKISGYANIKDKAEISGRSVIAGCSVICGSAKIQFRSIINGNAIISGNSIIGGDDTIMIGYGRFNPNAHISSDFDFIVFDNIGSEHGTLTAFLNKERDIYCTRGCFEGTLEEFEKAVKKTHGDNDFAKEYHIAIELIKRRLMGNWEE